MFSLQTGESAGLDSGGNAALCQQNMGSSDGVGKVKLWRT